MLRFALAVALGLTLGCAPTVTGASPSPSASLATTTPSPSPSVASVSINVTTPVSAIPRSFHYFSVGRGAGFRILLFDEEAARPPIEVLRSGPVPVPAGPDVRTDAFSASTDGRVLVVMRRLSEQETGYYLLRPETGEIRALLSGSDLGPPVLAADGRTVAFLRNSQNPALHGLWLMAVAPGAPPPVRLARDDPQRSGGPPQPLAWSADGKWLAIAIGLGDVGPEVAVVDPAGGELRFDATANALVGGRGRIIGPGGAVDWRGGERALLVTSSRTAFGGRSEIYTADVTTGALRSLYRPTADVTLAAAAMHPAVDRFAYSESPFCCGARISAAVWVRQLDGGALKVGDAGGVPWWSADGTKLFATVGGDDSTSAIVDVLSGRAIQFCLRSLGAPPGCL